MIRQAVECDDPVVFFEPKRRYWSKGEVVTDVSAVTSLDRARVVVPGTDVTLVTYGPLVQTAEDDGVSIEVIDLRSLAPLDEEAIVDSVQKTGRIVIAHEAARFGGLGAEIAAMVTERCFDRLTAPPLRVTGHDIPYPPSELEDHYLPDLDRMLDGVDRVMGVRV
jgi:pyruvate dehydrogenase E1 component beta subunit